MRWIIPLMLMGWFGTALAAAPVILVMGDSLSAGHGIKLQAGWVNLLSQRLKTQGYDYSVVNASVSGETSSGAKNRFPALLKTHHPAIVILEIGANDGLRGLPTQEMHDNIAEMISEARRGHAAVVLVGMRMPPNYGATYTQSFMEVYTALAKATRVRFVPFFLKDVALNDSLMQADNIHPNEQGQPYLLNAVWPALKPLLKHGH